MLSNDKNPEVILMKGLMCSGKSYFVNQLKNNFNQNITVISSDEIRAELNLDESDEQANIISFYRICEALKRGDKRIVLDSMNLNQKSINRLKNVYNVTKIQFTKSCYYMVRHPYIWEEFVRKRINNEWIGKTMDDMYHLRQSRYDFLSYPDDYFDNIKLFITDIPLNQDDIDKFNKFYIDNFELFINNTRLFIHKSIEANILQKAIPEIMTIIGYDQQNSHHTSTLDEHTFEVCEELPKTEEWIWTGLLHDLGKLTRGIKQKKAESNDYCYRGHAGASAEIAICILNRLGFDEPFINNVVSVIARHMYLPYEGELSNKKKKSLGRLYKKLVIFREADCKRKQVK